MYGVHTYIPLGANQNPMVGLYSIPSDAVLWNRIVVYCGSYSNYEVTIVPLEIVVGSLLQRAENLARRNEGPAQINHFCTTSTVSL